MAAPTSSSSSLRHAWLVVGLLVPVALLNYLDRQLLASMKSSMTHDISGIGSEAQWGVVLALFKWVYAGLSPVGGYLADRYDRRHVIVGSLVAWSAVTWATGHVVTYEQLLTTRALMGTSEALAILKTEFGLGQGLAGVSATLYWTTAAIAGARAPVATD